MQSPLNWLKIVSMRKLRTIEMKRLSLEEFKEAKKLPLIVVLDNVRSLHNVGSVFRTCDAFKVEAVFLCGITATPPNAEIHKTALGGEDAVEWQYFAETEDAIKELHKRGFFVYSIEQVAGSTMLQNLHTSLKNDAKKYAHPSTSPAYAVVFGNEVKGVKQSVIDLSDDCLEIPQFGTKHSLNVSVTAGIVIWEFARHLLLG